MDKYVVRPPHFVHRMKEDMAFLVIAMVCKVALLMDRASRDALCVGVGVCVSAHGLPWLLHVEK